MPTQALYDNIFLQNLKASPEKRGRHCQRPHAFLSPRAPAGGSYLPREGGQAGMLLLHGEEMLVACCPRGQGSEYCG